MKVESLIFIKQSIFYEYLVVITYFETIEFHCFLNVFPMKKMMQK